MLLCEAFLMTIIVMLGIYVTYTDIKSGIIQNKALMIASIVGVAINIIYYIVFASDFIKIYVINLLMMLFLAVAFYGFHFWAAGDSKLLICVNLLFPARFYDNDVFSFAPGINVIICIFLIAYAYIIIDSLIQFEKKEKFYAGKQMELAGIKQFVVNYFVSFLYLRGFSKILRFFIGDIYYENQLFFCFINMFIAIIVYSKKTFKHWYMLLGVLAVNLIFGLDFSFSAFNLYSCGVLLIALLLRDLLSGYNYKEIPTESVSRGMVLSYATIMLFVPSRIKGLPNTTSEDMRSRITQEEVEAIKRWKNSKYGKETITIVRKIPFAIFIVIGEILYFLVRVVR